MKKTILLFLVSLASLFLFFLVPKNREWLNNKPVAYWNDFRKNRNKTDPEQRKIARWGSDYIYSKQIAGQFSKDSQANVLVLLPPSKYFTDRKINFHVPEPAVFYYYTGLRTAWVTSEKAMQANWLVVARDKKLVCIPVTDQQMLADSIAFFKKYPARL